MLVDDRVDCSPRITSYNVCYTKLLRVKASSRVEARQMVQDNCGMVLHSGIQTTLEDDVIDWNFSCHPDKKIVSVVK